MALDVARVLVTDPDELAKTDMAEHAVEALRHSNIREVVIVGRRGPAQAAYTNPELIALGQMADVDIVVDPDEVILDAASRAWVDGPDSEPSEKLKVRQVEEFAKRTATDGRKRIVLRFLASPAELIGDDRVESIRLVRNELVADDAGKLTARATNPHRDARDRSGAAVDRLQGSADSGPAVRRASRRGPQRERSRHRSGDRQARPRRLRRRWIKRGPTGVIGTNKHCSAATVDLLLSDFSDGLLPHPGSEREHLGRLVGERQPEVVDFQGWQRIDKQERALGAESGRSRTKIVDIAAMLEIARGEAG